LAPNVSGIAGRRSAEYVGQQRPDGRPDAGREDEAPFSLRARPKDQRKRTSEQEHAETNQQRASAHGEALASGKLADEWTHDEGEHWIRNGSTVHGHEATFVATGGDGVSLLLVGYGVP